MASGVWSDFDNFVNAFLPKQTIPKLRLFSDQIYALAGINLQLRSSERKSDLVDKVRSAFLTMKQTNNEQVYRRVRRECEQIALNTGRVTQPAMPVPTFGGVPAMASSSHQDPAGRRVAGGYPAPRPAVAGWQQAAHVYPNVGQPKKQPLLDWKASPMWKPLRPLTEPLQLPDIESSESSHTRRERRAHFELTNDMIAKLNLNQSDPRSRPVYSVRLFCASSDYYRPPGMVGPVGVPPPTNKAIPIEFPINPDASVDGHMVPFKERGLRGKAGSAPPLDIDKGPKGIAKLPGRLGTFIMGHSGPTVGKRKDQAKKFWFQLVFCEVTSMEDLLAKLEALVPTDADAELAKLRKRAEEDDDIEYGTSTLSLKDPLSAMRITKPVRSSKCSHLQCFDARWWLEANRSHPQWLCPHCSKELDFTDIICDGYFLSILNTCPDEVEEVVLESSGDWHSRDNVYGTAAWRAKHGSAAPPVAVVTPIHKRERSETPPVDKSKRRAIEILSDSDDEDNASSGANGHTGYVNANGVPINGATRASSSAVPRQQSEMSSSRRTSAAPAPFIDLTLSDSDDDENDNQPARAPLPPQPTIPTSLPPPVPNPAGPPPPAPLTALTAQDILSHDFSAHRNRGHGQDHWDSRW